MTIRHYRVASARIDEVVRRVDGIWLERVRQMPGFVSYQLARTGDDELTSIADFIDRERGERAEEAAAEWVGAALMDLDVEFLGTSAGQVVVHAGP